MLLVQVATRLLNGSRQFLFSRASARPPPNYRVDAARDDLSSTVVVMDALLPVTTVPRIVGDLVEGLRSRGGDQLRRGIIGDERLTVAELATREDPGLFGPKSVAWRIHGDASMLVGGLRSLFFQTVHPLAMAGVAQHSDYKGDPWGRLNRTSRFVGATTFGSTSSAETAIAIVRRVHGNVVGTAPDGRPYAANDPHLLLWVHVAEIDSFLTAFDRYGSGNLRDADRNRYVEEMAEVARRLGSEGPPESVAELVACLDEFRSECSAGADAFETVKFLRSPPLPWWMRGTYASLAAGAITSLPTWARRELKLFVPPLADELAVRPVTTASTRMLGYLMSASADTRH